MPNSMRRSAQVLRWHRAGGSDQCVVDVCRLTPDRGEGEAATGDRVQRVACECAPREFRCAVVSRGPALGLVGELGGTGRCFAPRRVASGDLGELLELCSWRPLRGNPPQILVAPGLLSGKRGADAE